MTKHSSPPFPLPDPSRTSDLLSRVSSFLPQIQSANERLTAAADSDDNERQTKTLDADLKAKMEEDESSNSDDSDDQQQEEDEPAVPTISLQLALGNVEENPAISWLADDPEDESYKNGDDEGNEEEADNTKSTDERKESLVGQLLKRKPGEEEADEGTAAKRTKPKGPLITELS